MQQLITRLGDAFTRLLPHVTAEACTDSFFEYRCKQVGACRIQQRRSCRYCASGKVCGSWNSTGSCSCGGPCC